MFYPPPQKKATHFVIVSFSVQITLAFLICQMLRFKYQPGQIKTNTDFFSINIRSNLINEELTHWHTTFYNTRRTYKY